MMEHMLLQGITLTDDQKAKLEDVHKTERAQMKANGQNGRAEFDAIRDARQKGDSATANKLMAEQRTQMDARRDAQIASIRGLLTGDQQKQFDTNVTTMKQRGPGRGGPGRRPGI
jgi:Spy/CpxP family protein refolding chaperone